MDIFKRLGAWLVRMFVAFSVMYVLTVVVIAVYRAYVLGHV